MRLGLSVTRALGTGRVFKEALGGNIEGEIMKKGDGCTGFPDGYWADCCAEHDLFYEQGGSWKERQASDRRLRNCVFLKITRRNRGYFLKQIDDDGSIFMYVLFTLIKAWLLSRLMYHGVRIMGSPWCLPLYLWPRWRKRARWGFGT